MTAHTPAPYFKRDAQFRARLFDPRSFQHDAKANLYLVHWLATHLTEPGATLLDPMAGTGSTYISAISGSRRVICGELEGWMLPILDSNRRRVGPHSRARSHAYQGDAANLPLDTGCVDHILTSPPYWDVFSDWHAMSRRLKTNHHGPHGSAYADERGSKLKKNAGNEHVYEHYLARMRAIYQECGRVLRPGGRLVLIVKDRIAAGRRVPIVVDTTTLITALGFEIETIYSREAQLTQYRQLQKAKGMPVITDEQVIVARWPGPDRSKTSWALVMVPDVDHGPPRQVYDWSLLAARLYSAHILSLWSNQLQSAHQVKAFTPGASAGAKYTDRRASAFETAEGLISLGARAGDDVTLFVPWTYAAYLQTRLQTLGLAVEVPMRGLNMGQKMTWLKGRLA